MLKRIKKIQIVFRPRGAWHFYVRVFDCQRKVMIRWWDRELPDTLEAHRRWSYLDGAADVVDTYIHPAGDIYLTYKFYIRDGEGGQE